MNKSYRRAGTIRQGPLSIKDVVRKYLRASGISKSAAARQRQINIIWKKIVDRETALHTRVMGLGRGVLRVEVDSAARLQELASFRKAKLLEALKKEIPSCHIREIRFLLGPVRAASGEQKENLE